jgi:hypothetical protein
MSLRHSKRDADKTDKLQDAVADHDPRSELFRVNQGIDQIEPKPESHSAAEIKVDDHENLNGGKGGG